MVVEFELYHVGKTLSPFKPELKKDINNFDRQL